jgi:hypothetical protein
MYAADTSRALAALLREIVEGIEPGGGGFVLNSGDVGLLRSLEKITADEASRSTNGGATIAAHAQHVRYGLSLMNRWAREGGDPFADAQWDAAWKLTAVSADEWREIQRGLADEATSWRDVVGAPRPASEVALTGLLASVVHLAYHLGAIRQIAKETRGPREGTFATP